MQPAPSDERTSMSVLQYLVFVKWLLYSCLIGIVVGGVAISFHYGIDWSTAGAGWSGTGAPIWCWWPCGRPSL